ncbi:hypothetical protein [Lentimicrobium sp. S6]|uniref:hypothetical protein n=1 Tax=Lentimicrobium sp. S6 TaxID=2735872 RepID=UPI001552E7A4|nr:hypothetical protein [Lentimicrobium sp. S6]NPD47616.1 hypothetical protein [Lentimicrobium sp. S6]
MMKSNNINPKFLDLGNAQKIKSHVDELLPNVKNDDESNKQIFSATELLNRDVKEIPQLLEPILPKVGLCGFAGSSDTGKSSFLRQLAISVGLGEPKFLGFKLNAENKKAIYGSS